MKPLLQNKNSGKVVLHDDGSVSYRICGRWTHHVPWGKGNWEDIKQLPHSDRARLWYEGAKRGKDFISGVKVTCDFENNHAN